MTLSDHAAKLESKVNDIILCSHNFAIKCILYSPHKLLFFVLFNNYS